jgi:hypothetical protein
MKKVGKWSVALAMGVTMGLSLFSSGAFAQSVNSTTSTNQGVAQIGAVASYSGGQHGSQFGQNRYTPAPIRRYHKPIILHRPVVFHKPIVIHKPVVFHKPIVTHEPVLFHKYVPSHKW